MPLYWWITWCTQTIPSNSRNIAILLKPFHNSSWQDTLLRDSFNCPSGRTRQNHLEPEGNGRPFNPLSTQYLILISNIVRSLFRVVNYLWKGNKERELACLSLVLDMYGINQTSGAGWPFNCARAHWTLLTLAVKLFIIAFAWKVQHMRLNLNNRLIKKTRFVNFSNQEVNIRLR